MIKLIKYYQIFFLVLLLSWVAVDFFSIKIFSALGFGLVYCFCIKNIKNFFCGKKMRVAMGSALEDTPENTAGREESLAYMVLSVAAVKLYLIYSLINSSGFDFT
ncbi:hypothetical protein [Pelagibaculum spongiae]|uniref:Uncharacterized protein n=1 Tax=Pelagibaculum spongiae TaxID=2080658 RepID=A0A2V1GXK0_9GAMM|nr:hypothetical protein [Pelagibaculum spongiae]PVZ66656.1 hypothetical protein DC094_15415 [Pelagibaculum spongiae]